MINLNSFLDSLYSEIKDYTNIRQLVLGTKDIPPELMEYPRIRMAMIVRNVPLPRQSIIQTKSVVDSEEEGFEKDIEYTYFTNPDTTLSLNGYGESGATKATGQATFYGDEDISIPKGFEIETDESEPVRFETTESGDISSDGEVTLDIRALEYGEEGNVEADDITVIVNSISGLDSVNNNSETAGGAESVDYYLGKAREWFLINQEGRRFFGDTCVIKNISDTQDRHTFMETEYEDRQGFDVVLGFNDEIKVIEKTIETVEVNGKTYDL